MYVCRLGNVVKTVSSFLSGSFHSSSSSAGQPTPDGRTPDGHIPSCSYTIMHTNKELQSYSSDVSIVEKQVPLRLGAINTLHITQNSKFSQKNVCLTTHNHAHF